MHFLELPLHNTLLKAVSDLGYSEPTPVQEQVIPHILEGKDVITIAQTGTGKTAAFMLPLLQKLLNAGSVVKRGKKAGVLVLTPTRELAEQIQQATNDLAKHTNITAISIYGGIPLQPQINLLKKGADVIVATPGRLLDLYKQEHFFPEDINELVVDEADLMFDMGFIDDVLKIEKICVNRMQTVLCSATFPLKVEGLAKEVLKDPIKVNVTPKKKVTQNLSQILYYVSKSKKMELCLHLLRQEVKGKIIIFRRTRFGVEKLEGTLVKNGFSVAAIHGEKSQAKRQEALNLFKEGEADILIGTDVAARGIDIPQVDFVVNFDLPNIPQTYVHRIGRSGRAGETGIAISFCGADEKEYIKSIQRLIQKQLPVVEDHPYVLDPNERPQVHRKKSGSKYRKGRKSEASKKNKKRWY